MGQQYLFICFLWVTLQVEAKKDFIKHSGSFPPLTLADCFTKPTILVSKVKRPSVAVTTAVCQDSSVQLNLKNYPKGSTFQWQKAGTDIANATDSILVIKNSQAGVYNCVIRSSLCPDAISAETVVVRSVPEPTLSVTAGSPTGTRCQDGFVKLTASVSDIEGASYQWLHENKPIVNAYSTIYEAIETGAYSLKVTDVNGCVTISPMISVISNTPPKVDLSASKSGFCKGESVTLTATHGRTFLYDWLRDGQPIMGSTSITKVSVAGVYSVKATAPNGCTTESNAITIVQYNDPVVTMASTGNQLCPGAKLTLTASGKKLKKYQWLRNGQNVFGDTNSVFRALQAGNYAVAVIDSNGCKATSAVVAIEMVDKITVKLDSIPNFCGTVAAPIALKGTPSGGVFSGNGVVNDTFDSKVAGIGTHTIGYTIKGNLDCLNGEARRKVSIGEPTALDLGQDQNLLKGTSISLGHDLGRDYSYTWTPTVGVNAPNEARPKFSPEKTTTYRLVATSLSGCVVKDSVTIQVYAGVYAPDVFSPNGDGQNDVWELKGIEEYPTAEVSVFDRWGRVVYYDKGGYSKPFDGNNLSEGAYAYVIKTKPNDEYTLKGYVLLIR